ncbi:hypothetical protein [Brevibacillus sp. SIMBA_040]|uniref:hypothetical protein n=1 Tax=unclassified Brevibacillus TaxID=2684853 RepID=UPI0039792FB5
MSEVRSLDRLKLYYSEINTLNDEIPAQVTRKIYLYSLALLEIGRFHAEAVNEYGRLYAERKGRWGQIAATTVGSGVVKEATADQMTQEIRIKEAQAESEVHRWKNSFEATQEIINALKVHLKVLVKELDVA